jgi:hypothetical protein
MATRTAAPLRASDPPHERSGPAYTDIGARLAGYGALFFVVMVVLQNLVRGTAAPAVGASSQEALAYYADHRAITAVLIAGFVLNAAAFAIFVGGSMRRMIAGSRPAWAITGAIGAAGVVALFGVMVATEQAMSVVAAGDRPDASAIAALLPLHDSAFTVLHVSLGIALLGLSRAGVAVDMTPRVFRILAPVGAGLLALSAMSGPFTAAGDAQPFLGLGLLGFVVWLAFLATTGLRLVRSDRRPA